jgi:hypothetical protein
MLTVTNQIEPFTDSSKDVVPILAESDSYRRLYRDLRRYTTGQIQGRSYLIAGHRGSGKSMLVYKVIEDLLRDSLDRPQRPLFVRLHGPDLLPPIVNTKRVENSQPPGATPPANQIAIAFSGGSPASVNAFPQSGGGDTADAEMVNVLIQMMRSLFRDVTNEFRRCFREAILRTTADVRRQELLEIAAQFDLEILDGLTAARLREYWQRINKLDSGVLFTSDRSKYVVFSAPGRQLGELIATDLGMQEILALTFLSQAFQVVSGKIEEKQEQKNAAKDERSSTLSAAYAVKDLLAPVVGLLSGGAVGFAVGASVNPVTAVVLGLVTGSAVSLGFSYTRTRSQNRETISESTFIKDRSVASLSGVLPLLVLRLRQIGLVPVFVIDELDKVDQVEERMRKLVKHLKYLVTENSFTCFLTDRRYYSYVEREAKQTPYAAEYTYFSDRLLVLYEPSDLRQFVRDVVRPEPQYEPSIDPAQAALTADKDLQDIEKISYVLLHRARMHPIDLRRQIDRLATRQPFSMADFFSTPRYRFEIMIQLAIEWLLGGEDVRTQTGGDADSRQLLYDSLYYVSRLWEDVSTGERMPVPGFTNFGGDEEEKPGFVLDKEVFASYLASRYTPDTTVPDRDQSQPPKQKGGAAKDAQRLPKGTDFDFLFGKVKELLNWLSNPVGLYDEIVSSTRPDAPPRFILDEIPTATPLLQPMKGGYQWLYDTSGRYLETRDVESIISDIRKPLALIRQTENSLRAIGSLQLFADLGFIPRTLEWRNVEPMLVRLQRMMNDKKGYDRMSSDRDSVLEFSEILGDFEPHLKAAVMCASALLPDVPATAANLKSAENERAKFERALTHVAQILRLSGTDDDLERMNSVLRSTGIELPPVPSDAKWDQVINLARNWQKRAPSQTDKVVQASWDLFKDRFSERFRNRTFIFEPGLNDLVTSLNQFGAGSYFTFDLSTVTIARWTELLLRSLETRGVPKWIRVAAALELGFPQLAENLSASVDEDAELASRWIKDYRASAPTTFAAGERRGVLVITPGPDSLTSSWKPSLRHAAVACTATDFHQLRSSLKSFKVMKPADFPIDSVCVELKGTRETLASLASQKPLDAIAAMASTLTGTPSKDLEPFLNLPSRCYLAPETPADRTSTSTPEIPIYVGARSVDELVEKAWSRPASNVS